MKKIFMLLALVMTAMTASALTGPTFTVKKAATVTEGTVKFQVTGGSEAETLTGLTAGTEVTIKVTPPANKTVGEVTGLWYAGSGTAHAPRRADATIPLLTNFTPTFVSEDESTKAKTYTFTMINANAEISVKYAKMLTSPDITISVDPATYTGSPQQPTVTITDAEGNKKLVKGTDFTVSYSNNTNAGTGKVTITGKGNYSGTVTRTFTINKASSLVWFKPDQITRYLGDPDFIVKPKVAYGGMGMTYYSNNTSVATVDASTGLVHIVGLGTAKIYAIIYESANYGGATGHYELTVVERPATVNISVGASGMSTYCSGLPLNFTGNEDVKAYTVIGCSYDSKTIWLSRVYDVPAWTPIVITGAEGSYNIPTAVSSNSYFKNMLIGNNSGSTLQINETNAYDKMDNYYVKDGTFKKVNGYAYIADGKSYLQLPTTPTTAQTGSAVSIQLSSTGKSTLCSDVDLDFSGFAETELVAYVATGYDMGTQTFWFNRVLKASAGTPLYLVGTPGQTYTIPSTAAQTVFVNMLVGNLSGSTIQVSETAVTDGVQMRNLYLKDGTFKLVNGYTNIGNGKCYMQTPLSTIVAAAPAMDNLGSNLFTNDDLVPVKFSDITDDSELTGIDSLTPDPSPKGEGSIYMLDGRKVANGQLKKGIYILNGKKVVR